MVDLSTQADDDDDRTLLLALNLALADCQERIDDPETDAEDSLALGFQKVTLEDHLADLQNRIIARGFQASLPEHEDDARDDDYERLEYMFPGVFDRDTDNDTDTAGLRNVQPATPAAPMQPSENKKPGPDLHDTRECLACLEKSLANYLEEVGCGHEYCGGCLQQLIVASLNDETLFPASCCNLRISTDIEDRFMTLELRSKPGSLRDRQTCPPPIAPTAPAKIAVAGSGLKI